MNYFIGIIRNTLLSRWSYKFDFMVEGIESAMELFIQLLVWIALFATTEGQPVKGFYLTDLITYTVISRISGMVAGIKFASTVATTIQSGDIALMLIQPYSTRLTFIFKSIACSCVNLLVTAIPLLVIAISFKSYIVMAASTLHIIYCIIAMVFAIAIAIAFELLCSTLSFWKVPGDFVEWYFAIFFTMLSGAVVPLWFFPPWLLTIAKLLPFQAIFFIPAQIYMGKLGIKEITISLGTQAAWVILLLILHEVLWRRGMKRLTIEGG